MTGTTPPLHRGQLVRLSFELQAKRLEPAESAAPTFQSIGSGGYRGCGQVIRRYVKNGDAVVVIDAGDFRFYVHGSTAQQLARHGSVEFEGTLLLDHYLWVEFLERYPDPPDLFYNLRVTRIRRVRIPDRFVRRGARSMSAPTHVPPHDFGAVEEVQGIGEVDALAEFYLVDFDDQGLKDVEIPRTFRE